MNFTASLIDVMLHLDKYLNIIIQNYGTFTYAIIFIVIFCETGLVVTPFLPGDSIIFTAGALAAENILGVFTLFIVFFAAAVLGDTANYFIGKKIGNNILKSKNTRFVNKEHIYKAHRFYEKHGPMALVLGRFVPVIRTFVPFVAGIGEMKYFKFLTHNMLGGFLWVSMFLWGGYFFGSLPFIKHNFSYVVIAIIVISLIPAVVVFMREKKSDTANAEI